MKKRTHPVPDMNSEALKEFRQAAYELLVKAKDATFELMDAVMTTRNTACLAEFSLSPLFTRQSVQRRTQVLAENGIASVVALVKNYSTVIKPKPEA